MQKTSSKSSAKRTQLIQDLVDRGYQLYLQVIALTDELQTIKEQLKAHAVAHPIERIALIDPYSEGTQWVASGKQGECRVLFPAPRLASEIPANHRNLRLIRSLTQEHFGVLFRETISFQPSDKQRFRQALVELLDPDVAAQVLELCTSPSEPRTTWKPAKGANS